MTSTHVSEDKQSEQTEIIEPMSVDEALKSVNKSAIGAKGPN